MASGRNQPILSAKNQIVNSLGFATHLFSLADLLSSALRVRKQPQTVRK